MMKKYNIALILFILIPLCLVSCAEEDDEEDRYTIGNEFNGSYLGHLDLTLLDGTVQQIPQKVYLTRSQKDEHTNLEMRHLLLAGKEQALRVEDVLATTTVEGAPLDLFLSQDVESATELPSYKIDLVGKIEEGVIDVEVELVWADEGNEELPKKFHFVGNFETTQTNSSADIKSVTLDSRLFLPDGFKQDIESQKFYLTTLKGVTEEQLSHVALEFELADGATCEPAMGSVQNLNNPVTYTVTSEDGVLRKDYTFSILKRPEIFTFDRWEVANPTAPTANQYQLPTAQNELTWASYDAAFAPYMGYPVERPEGSLEPIKPTSAFSVQSSTDAVSGRAVKLVSQKGVAQPIYNIPSLVPAMLYLGTFTPGSTASIAGGKFGVPVHYKPIALKGSYKYQPGDSFYMAGAVTQPYDLIRLDNKRDQFRIMALIYKVNDRFDTEEMLSYTALLNSDKVIGVADLSSYNSENSYKSFEVPVVYSTEYSYGQDYKIALFATPSVDQDIYQMAIGSTLWIDNLEIVTE